MQQDKYKNNHLIGNIWGYFGRKYEIKFWLKIRAATKKESSHGFMNQFIPAEQIPDNWIYVISYPDSLFF